VVQGDNGATDQGTPITFDIVTSFQVLGTYSAQISSRLATQKRATMCRPLIVSSGVSAPVLDVNVDYNIMPVGSPVVSVVTTTEWDQFNWDQASWASSNVVQSQWYSVDGIGTAFSIHMSGTAQTLMLQVLAWDLTYEIGIGFI
jgi:hypothetical protein